MINMKNVFSYECFGVNEKFALNIVQQKFSGLNVKIEKVIHSEIQCSGRSF